MIKKIALSALLILFLNGCNYQPIYSSKNIKFSIGEFQSSGDNKINKLLIKKLEIYKNDNFNTAKYNLNINSEINKNISTKDEKGNPTTFILGNHLHLSLATEDAKSASGRTRRDKS